MRGKQAKEIRRLAEFNTIGQDAAATRKEIKLIKRELHASRHPPQGCPKRKGYFNARSHRI